MTISPTNADSSKVPSYIEKASHIEATDKEILGRYYRWLTETQRFPHTSADSIIKEHLKLRLENDLFNHNIHQMTHGLLVPERSDPDEAIWSQFARSPRLLSAGLKGSYHCQYFNERERTTAVKLIHYPQDSFKRSMTRLQEKASVMILVLVPGDSERPARTQSECTDPTQAIDNLLCHESRAIREFEWGIVWMFSRMLASLGLSETEAEDKVAQWLKSRVDNILSQTTLAGIRRPTASSKVKGLMRPFLKRRAPGLWKSSR
ncbi:hypothetical protein B0H11DRAFT_1950103 [Mycena galericulata]|nr:hypothetical protein B0H11DRAFT_1950103 [Mycena galericulata]